MFETPAPHSALLAGLLMAFTLCGSSHVVAQQRPVHRLLRSDMPSGALGAARLARNGSTIGYQQPVRIKVPQGATVAIAGDGDFSIHSTVLQVGLLVGQPYRLRISDIPQHDGQMLYPSIEVLDRLHPPAGQKDRFPIPVEITQDDLELALRGSMVVRVIYLENPERAFPEREDSQQRSVDVLPSEDPLHVADDLGRPMAILRLGSRVPLDTEGDGEFCFGSPPVVWSSDSSNQDQPVFDDPTRQLE
jgi:hypothetical protein